jgi:hypothetical protein
MLQTHLQGVEINRLKQKNREQAERLAIYVQQFTPLQKVQNGIAVDDLEANDYIMAIWHKHRNYWGE